MWQTNHYDYLSEIEGSRTLQYVIKFVLERLRTPKRRLGIHLIVSYSVLLLLLSSGARLTKLAVHFGQLECTEQNNLFQVATVLHQEKRLNSYLLTQ